MNYIKLWSLLTKSRLWQIQVHLSFNGCGRNKEICKYAFLVKQSKFYFRFPLGHKLRKSNFIVSVISSWHDDIVVHVTSRKSGCAEATTSDCRWPLRRARGRKWSRRRCVCVRVRKKLICLQWALNITLPKFASQDPLCWSSELMRFVSRCSIGTAQRKLMT